LLCSEEILVFQSTNNQDNLIEDNMDTAEADDQDFLNYKHAEQNGLFENLDNIHNDNYLDIMNSNLDLECKEKLPNFHAHLNYINNQENLDSNINIKSNLLDMPKISLKTDANVNLRETNDFLVELINK